MVDADCAGIVDGSGSSTERAEKEEASSSGSLHDRDGEWSMIE